MQIKNIIDVLGQVLSSVPDQDEAYKAADRMYDAKFRSEAEKVSICYPDTIEGREYFAFDFDCIYDPDLMVVYFCNYKGEGKGVAVYSDEFKHLPIFRGKNASFDYFGA